MQTIADFLERAVRHVVEASWQAAVIAGIVLLVCLVLRDRMSARWRCALWLVVLARLLMPTVPESRLSLFNLAAAAPSDRASQPVREPIAAVPAGRPASRADTASGEPTRLAERPAVARPPVATAASATAISPPSTPSQSQPALSGWQVAGVVWLLGALFVVGRAAVSATGLYRALKRCRPVAEGKVNALFDASCREMRVRRRVVLLASPTSIGPAVAGLFRPRLIVSDRLFTSLSREELRLVFLHELAHVRRHDVVVRWLWAAARAVHWFNPLVWFAGLRTRSDCELACDEAVLGRVDRKEQFQYGRTILSVVQSLRGSHPVPGTVGVLTRKPFLTRRIAMIANYRDRSRQWTLFSAGVLLILTLVGLSGAVEQLEPTATPSEAGRKAFLGPIDVAASRDGKTLYVALADAGEIAVVDAAGGKLLRSIEMPAEPTGLALSPDGATLYVTCAAPEGTVAMVDVASGQRRRTIQVGHWPAGPALSPDGKKLYVCNRFDNNVAVVDLEVERVTLVPATREPFAAVVTPDGKSVFVINRLPIDRADSYDVASVVTVIDTATNDTQTIRMPNGATGMQGICVSPDGKHVYATHLLSRYQMPTTQLERGWMNTNALSIIDAGQKKLLNTVLLDDIDLGAANPWGVASTPDGKTICVTHAGTHEVSIIDAKALLEKLVNMPATEEEARAAGRHDDRGTYSSLTATDVPNDLAFLRGLRQRVGLAEGGRTVNGPRGLAVVGSKAFVAAYFTDNLSVVDLEPGSGKVVRTIALGPKPQMSVERRGQMLFGDATCCFQHWQSCASCHPDARVDALNWDLMNDGMGNPKNVRSLLLAHRTPPSMSVGVLADAEAAVRDNILHRLFAMLPDDDEAAINAYLKSLEPVPSPYLVDGKLSPAAERGKKLFFDGKTNCAKCHPEPLLTDMLLHDIGSRGQYDRRDAFDTPTLVECWRTAPYMHDGRYTTVKELLTQGQHGKQDGNVDQLSEQQIHDLVEYVLSL
ncbi:MAG: M56 family metallopeptidase [Planctomycetota bacterium]|jgi:YVTN family beta-propeller protein